MNGFKDALKSAGLVFLYTTIALWIPGLLGWINEVTNWANQKGAPPFPDPSNLAFLFVAALTAAFPAALAFIVRFIENTSGIKILPRSSGAVVSDPPRGQGGYLSGRDIALIAAVVLIIVVLILAF